MGLWDPSGAYLLGWSRGREEAAGSSAELKVLVTQSSRRVEGGEGRLMKQQGEEGPGLLEFSFARFSLSLSLSSVDKGLLSGLWGLGGALAMKEEREMGQRTGEASVRQG